MKRIFLSLGSNLGDRAENLSRARHELGDAEVQILAQSSLYETEPQGLANQPWFLNQVVEAATDLFPRQLLWRVKKIEQIMGRQAAVRNGPRVIDIDILLFGNAVVNTPDLVIPHSGLAERRFVLAPLAELTHDLRHPVTRLTAKEMLSKISAQPVRKL